MAGEPLQTSDRPPVTPPPLPPLPPMASRAPLRPPDRGQTTFDRVIGPNLRLADNLIQLACVVVGSVVGAWIGQAWMQQGGLAIGLFVGMVGSILISGLVIGIVRFVRRPGR